MPKLWKPISAFLYSRLLTWADAIEEGLNPPRSFNLVSAARNRPSGDPNCELFPQVTIIPVPPSTPPYRPVGAYGNNRAVFPGRNAKKASEPEGPEAVVPVISLVALPCGDAETASGGTQQHQNTSSEASSRYSHSMALVLSSRHSSCTQFSASTRNACLRMTRCRVSSASGTKFGTTSKTFFKLRALSFCFCPKGASGRDSGARLGGIARF